MSLSVCIIAHNEEDNLERALLSAAWADDVVVVDCGSTDGTPDIARRHGVRLFSRPNLSNLNVNKNYSFDQARGDWILCLDADESLSEELSREMRDRIAAAPEENGFFFRRENSWFGRVLRHGGHFPDRQLRLFRAGRGRFPERHVHERLLVDGPVGQFRAPLSHVPYRSVSQYVRKMDFYTSFEAEQRFRKGETFGPGSFFIEVVRGKFRFFRRYVLKGGFLDGWQGFAAAYLDFLSRIVAQLKIRDLQERGGTAPD